MALGGEGDLCSVSCNRPPPAECLGTAITPLILLILWVDWVSLDEPSPHVCCGHGCLGPRPNSSQHLGEAGGHEDPPQSLRVTSLIRDLSAPSPQQGGQASHTAAQAPRGARAAFVRHRLGTHRVTLSHPSRSSESQGPGSRAAKGSSRCSRCERSPQLALSGNLEVG